MDEFDIDDANHMHYLTISRDEAMIVNEWCASNMRSRWVMVSYIEGYGAIPPSWYFESREDHVTFLMRWA